MSYSQGSSGVLRALVRAAMVLGLGIIAIVIVVSWFGAFPASGLQLTVDETLALLPQQERRVPSGDSRANWFRCANPKANEELLSKYRTTHLTDQKITIVSILGYTGSDAEARFVIEQLRQRSEELISGERKEVRHDKYLLLSMLGSLGNMGRRGVQPAKQFVENVAKGQDAIRIPVGSPVWTRLWGIEAAYAFFEPKDLDTTIQAARKAIPASVYPYAEDYDFRRTYRSLRKREAKWIWASEVRSLKRKAALLKSSSHEKE